MNLSWRASLTVGFVVFVTSFVVGLLLPEDTGRSVTYYGIVGVLLLIGAILAWRLTRFRSWKPGPAAFVYFILIVGIYIGYVLVASDGIFELGRAGRQALLSALFTGGVMLLVLFPYIVGENPGRAMVPPQDKLGPLDGKDGAS